MQIVIEIDEMIYDGWRYEGRYANHNYAQRLILAGTPLPKGHGRLIDASQLLTVTDCNEDGTERCYVPYVHLECATTIIEADKESEVEE